jgi:hypothetical protein
VCVCVYVCVCVCAVRENKIVLISLSGLWKAREGKKMFEYGIMYCTMSC